MTITDTFNRADGTLNGSTTSDGNATWTTQVGTWNISTNTAHPNFSGISVATVPTAADGTFQITVSTIDASVRNGLVVRFQDVNNYWALVEESGTSVGQVIKRSGGTDSVVGSFTAAGSGDVLSVVASGATLTFALNGTTVKTDTSGFLSTATLAGLRSNGTAGNLDGFSFTPPAAPAFHPPRVTVRSRAVSRASVI